MLKAIPAPPMSMAKAILSRLKIIRGPQHHRAPHAAGDGRARVVVNGAEIDLRIATMPTMQGESAVVRLLRFLQVEQAGETARLVRRRAPFPGGRVPLDGIVPGDPVVLLEGPLALSFAFSADTSLPLTWTDRWADRAEPPRRVRLIARDRGSGADLLPPLVFTIRADAPPSCAAPDATATCVPAVAALKPAPGGSTGEPAR